MSETNVVGIAAVWRAFNLIAESLASMEWEVVERLKNATTRIDYEHPLYFQLNTEPSSRYSSFDFWFALVFNTLLYGNGYALMDMNPLTARTKSFKVLDSSKIKVWETEDGTVFYKDESTGKTYSSENIIHLKWVTKNGTFAVETLSTLRDVFGFALASRDFGNTFYKNGAHLGGIIKHPGKLSQEAYNRLGSSFRDAYSGVDNAGKTPILEEGSEFQQLGMKPAEAALIESQKFSIEDVSRITGVPPHLLASLDRATFNNIEHLSLEFAKYALRPWVIRIEKEFTRKAFQVRERNKRFLRGDMTPFMVGDMNSQATMYSKMFTSGALSINDIRDKLGYNPVDGGDEHFVPVNMQPLSIAIKGGVNAITAMETPGEQNSDEENLTANQNG